MLFLFKVKIAIIKVIMNSKGLSYHYFDDLNTNNYSTSMFDYDEKKIDTDSLGLLMHYIFTPSPKNQLIEVIN